jgi:hypothetical protein
MRVELNGVKYTGVVCAGNVKWQGQRGVGDVTSAVRPVQSKTLWRSNMQLDRAGYVSLHNILNQKP